MSALPISIGAVGEDVVRIDQSLAVLREGLGRGFITTERFRQYAASRVGNPFRSALAATDNATGRVVGVLTIEIVDAKAIRESFLEHYERFKTNADIRLLQFETTGLIKSIAVSPALRGSGVATALIKHGMHDLAEHGANHYYSLAWVSKQQGCALGGVLRALGFRRAQHIERFWYHDSLANGYRCPSCGNPCECSVDVMIR